jgi:polyphenol oxidase
MKINFERKALDNCYVNICDIAGATFGFTEFDFSDQMLMKMFDIRPGDQLELKQTHSDIIRFSHRMKAGGEFEEGDGIILTESSRMAIIKTADCTPLFFWPRKFPSPPVAGVIHIGWRGLHAGIEEKLFEKFDSLKIDPVSFYYYLGPAIESKCYEVGSELYRDFRKKSYRDDIFSAVYKKNDIHQLSDKYLLDVRKGIYRSLQAMGIPSENIGISSLCTYCEADRLPSYRREKGTGKRILNFLITK